MLFSIACVLLSYEITKYRQYKHGTTFPCDSLILIWYVVVIFDIILLAYMLNVGDYTCYLCVLRDQFAHIHMSLIHRNIFILVFAIK